MPILIVIAGDRLLIRDSLRMVLEAAGFHVAANAVTLPDALRRVRAAKADILVVDSASPELDAAEAGRELPRYSRSCRVVALAETAEEVPASLAAGVRGCMLWSQPVEDFIAGIVDVAAGRLHVCREALRALPANRATA